MLALSPSTPSRDAVALHLGSLRAYLGSQLSDPVLVEEVTQEAAARALARLDTLREPAHLKAWLFGIARHVAAELLRGRRRFQPLDPEEETAAAGDERGLDARRTLSRVPAALEKLGVERRNALLLRVDEELGYDEIATRMGWSLAKVKNEIHRARVDLRALVAACLAFVVAAGVYDRAPSSAPLRLALRDRVALRDARCLDDSAEVARLEGTSGACLAVCPVLVFEAAFSVGPEPEAGLSSCDTPWSSTL